MSAAPFTPSDAAPACVRSYGVIMANLAGVAARLLQRNPVTLVLALPLWVWLNRSVKRLERAMARAVSARKRDSRAGVPDTAVRKKRVRLPGRWMWLRRMLGWEVAAFGSQLQHLLLQPEMQEALATKPAVARILRPVCRMLGVQGVPGLARARTRRVRAVVPVVVTKAVRAKRAPTVWPSAEEKAARAKRLAEGIGMRVGVRKNR